MKFFLYLLLFCGQIAFAKNVVLLSSLPDKDIKATVEIKRQFYKKLYGVANYGNELIYVNNASIHHLHKYLNDPETVALFWVSHGGHTKMRNSAGIGATSVLIDYQKVNVAKVFQNVHPNIKFLGILGCNSRQIVSKHLEQREDLGVYMPSYSVVATWSFRVALKKFKRHFWKYKYQYLNEDVLYDGYPITISRSVTKDSRALMIFAGKNLIGVMPPLAANLSQTQTFYVPHSSEISKYDFKINIKSGLVTSNHDDFGDIEVTHAGNNYWKLFAKRDGTPFGVNQRLFVFKNQIENIGIENNIIKHKVNN